VDKQGSNSFPGGGQANLYVYVANDPANVADEKGTGPQCDQCIDKAFGSERECQYECFKHWPICSGESTSDNAYLECLGECARKADNTTRKCFESRECQEDC
jgi:hypothetical protein